MIKHDPSPRPTLILTRPALQAERFARAFAARFGDCWPIVISPMSRLDILTTTLSLDDVETLVFTSETGVTAFLRLSQRRDLHAWCVGERTAEVARAAGFRVSVGPGFGAGMIEAIIDESPRGVLLHVHGLHMAVDVARELTNAGLRARGATVYDQIALPPTPQALSLLMGDGPILLPLFSPRAAQLMTRLDPLPRAPLHIAAISPAVARAVEALCPRQIEIAREPAAGMMLDALERLIAAQPEWTATRA
jgi:uroporphyrinogen-III synthase